MAPPLDFCQYLQSRLPFSSDVALSNKFFALIHIIRGALAVGEKVHALATLERRPEEEKEKKKEEKIKLSGIFFMPSNFFPLDLARSTFSFFFFSFFLFICF